MHGHEHRIPEFWAPRDPPCSWSRFPPRDLLRLAPLRAVMSVQDGAAGFGVSSPAPWWPGPAAPPAARGSQAEPWDAADIPGLQELWLRSVSGPSAPCKLPPLPSKRYLCSEEPKFPSCSLPEPSTERQGSGPWPRRASVPPRAREERQGPAGPGVSVLPQRSRQAGAFKRWSHSRVTAL